MSRLIILILFFNFSLFADDFSKRVVLLEKSEVKESVKSIQTDKCITESGQEIKLSEVSEIYFNEKTSSGVAPMLLTLNDGLIFTKNFKYVDGLVKFTIEDEDCVFSIKYLKGVIYKNSINDQNKLWKDIYNQPFRKLDTLFVIKDNKLVTVEGVIKEIDGEKVKITWEDSLKTISIEKIAGLVFASDTNISEFNFELYLRDGSKIFCNQITLDENLVKYGFIKNELNLTLPLKVIHKIGVINTRLIYLSDLTPTEAFSDNILLPNSENWVKNLSMRKKTLMIGSKSYNKGFGVHAYNRLKYNVKDDYMVFVTDYGIDNDFSNCVGCIFKINLDGKTILQQVVKGGEQARTFSYDVPRGSLEITLIIEPGPGLDIGDYGVWGNTRFVKNK